MPDWKKFIAAKIALTQRDNPKSAPSSHPRVPPGQTLVNNFPVLDLGILPDINKDNWCLRVYGLVQQPLELNWVDFLALPQTTNVSDFHCVTRWSRLNMDWQGVLARDLLALAKPLAEARFVTLHSFDNYTTNVALEVLLDPDVLIAHSVLGYSLTTAHGGPARMVIPKRYGWKSAKWLKAIELHAEDRRGFWEVRGYHNEADPFKEQRFATDEQE